MALFRGSIALAKAAGREMAINFAVLSLAAGLAVLGGGFLVAAGYLALAVQYGSIIACGMMGAGLVALAALLVAIRFARSKPVAPRTAAPLPPPPIEPMAQTAFEIGYGIGRALFGRRRD